MKMRVLKKSWAALVALFTTLAMALTLVSPSPVSALSTHTITAPDNNHVYQIYQIFVGDYDAEEDSLTNLVWGLSGTGTVNSPVEQDVLDALAEVANSENDNDKLDVIVQYVNLAAPSDVISNDPSDSYPSVANVYSGYYLIRDRNNEAGEGDAVTQYIVQIAGDITITPKSDVPESQKKVKDVNDSIANSETEWQDSADYDIGDHVPFQLTFNLPENVSAYSNGYFVTFNDTLSAGLTYDSGSAVIYVNGNQVAQTEPTGNLTWNLGNVTQAPYNAGNGDIITIEYTATLNDGAVIGHIGNPNTLNVSFSNNPNGSGTGTTPDDTVIVFTYETIVNKVDGEDKPLAGAAFKLEKQLADGTWKLVEEITAGNTTEFRFSGLDDGTYRLTETTTPAGYNPINPIVFIITADHEVLSDSPELTSVTAAGHCVDDQGNQLDGTITLTSNEGSKGFLYTNVVNLSGSTLPETGGIGTTIFYIVGGVLVLVAVVVLVAKRRADHEE